MKKLMILVCSIISISFTGCINDSGCDNCTFSTGTAKTNITNKIALICSLTKVNPKAYGGWDGACPGTDIDAKNFAELCAKNNIPYIKLENSQCTNQHIKDMWKKCISKLDTKDGLFIFFYSGHGGQVYSSTEKDGLDETLCFWDGEMVDDTVWKLLNSVPKTCRIFMVTDCCNSGSNFQLPYNLERSKKKLKIFSRSGEPNMVHFGGCNDGESSYGSNYGGTFTLNLKKYYNPSLTYKQWFDKVLSVMKNSQQVPTFAETGKSFKNTKIFK